MHCFRHRSLLWPCLRTVHGCYGYEPLCRHGFMSLSMSLLMPIASTCDLVRIVQLGVSRNVVFLLLLSRFACHPESGPALREVSARVALVSSDRRVTSQTHRVAVVAACRTSSDSLGA